MKRLFICINIIFYASTLYSHNITQKTSNLNELLKQAEETQKSIIEKLKNINIGIKVIDPGIKGIETINRLLKTRANGNAAMITDYSRATIVVKEFYEIYNCLELLKKNFNILSIDDHYAYPFPGMYRDINVVIEDPINGHIGEIQINTDAMTSFKNEHGHHLFDEIRKIQAREILENRKLTSEENQLLAELMSESKKGHNDAFAASHIGTRIGVYGICICENKILMVKTQSGKRTIFNFPGGGSEYFEGFIETLKRECTEELGCDVTIGNLLFTNNRLYVHPDFPNNNFHLYYNITLNSLFDPKIQDAQWFDLNNLPIESMLEIDKAIIPTLMLKNKL